MKRKCIETPFITSLTNHLLGKTLPEFYSSLMQSKKKAAILRILPGFADKFKPDVIQYENKLLKKLYLEELANLFFEDLLIKCNSIYETITITQKETLNDEPETTNQEKKQSI